MVALASGATSAGERESILPATTTGRRFVVVVLLVALAVRVAVVAKIHSHYAPLTDALNFDHIASSLSHGNGFGHAEVPPATGPTAFRAPLYPMSLAVVYAIFGDHSWTMGLLTEAVIGVVVVALVGVIGAQLWSRRIGAIAMAIAAVHPAMVLVGSSLQLEPLLVALSLATLAAVLQHRRAPRGLRWPIVAGVLLGLATLTREQAFLALPPLAWLLYTAPRPPTAVHGAGGDPAPTARRARFGRQELAAPLLLLVLTIAVMAPWTIRNAVRLHAFVPVSTSSGIGLAGTFNETSVNDKDHPGRWRSPFEDPTAARILTELHDPNEVDVDVAMRKMSIDTVRDNPTFPVKLAFWNTLRMFDLDGGDYSYYLGQYLPYPHWLIRLSVYGGLVVLAVALVGAFDRRARAVPFAVWAIPLILTVFILFVLPASIRYRASLEPYSVLLASLAISPIVDRLIARYRPPA